MIKKLVIAVGTVLVLISNANAEFYKLDPKPTQCYLFDHDKLQQKVACTMTGTAATGKIWSTHRNFRLVDGRTIKTLAKDTQRRYLTKSDKVLMPYTSELNPNDEQFSIATINNRPAIRHNRWLKNYRAMSLEEFWEGISEKAPNDMADRLACLQVEDKSFEICTPYNENDFRTG